MNKGSNMASNGWDEYKKMFLDDREQRRVWEHDISEKLNLICIEVAKLKIKSGIWGALAGMIPGFIALIYLLLR